MFLASKHIILILEAVFLGCSALSQREQNKRYQAIGRYRTQRERGAVL